MANKSIRSLSARKELDQNLFENIAALSKQHAGTEAFRKLAREFMVDDSVVFGTRSFYDFIKPENSQNKIQVCSGTACMVAGSQEHLRDLLQGSFSPGEIGHAACVGRCHSNSALMYKDRTYTVREPETLKELLETDFQQPNDYAIAANTTPVLTGPIEGLGAFYGLAEKWVSDPEGVIEHLKRSKLRGRGGAGFPFWFKLDAARKAESDIKYVVCNADEGDPGAYSDMYLLELQPHKVLFGMYMAGLVAGAQTGVLYIRGEYPDSIKVMTEAIHGFNQLDLPHPFKFKIIPGQGSYVCGEETALLNSIEGLRPEVRVRPPYPAEYGLYGKPTLLSNVETFANLHWILNNGGDAYALLGTEGSSGTKLVSLDSFFNNPGVFEIEMGTPMVTIFDEYGKGLKDEVKAFQIGGPLGGIVPSANLEDLTLDFESFDDNGFLLGHASVVSIPARFPMIRFLEHLMEFTADESCGKCYPCRIGSYRGMELLRKAQNESFQVDYQLFEDLLETLEIGSLCALGGGLPLPVKNALQHFEEELRPFFKR
jgi:NADH-quinone oxidoreductase subunit F